MTTFSTPLCLALACALPIQDDDFTTGPPRKAPDRDHAQRGGQTLGGGAQGQSDSNADDIRVNQVTTSAQNETSFTIDPDDPDHWVGVANDYSQGGVETGWYTTLDGGQTFATGTFGLEPGFGFSGDPCVTFLPDGTVVVVCMQYSGPGGNAVFSYRSTDGGITWQNGVEIDRSGLNDKPQLDADRSQGPHRGSVTTAWDEFSTADVYVSTSADGGVTWSSRQSINDSGSPSPISPDVAYGVNSELYVMWADRATFDIWVDVSFDNGATWGTDRHVSAYNQVPSPIPGSNFRMFDIFSIAADWTDGPFSGNVYVAYHHWKAGQQHADIRCATSTDEGLTWNIERVHDDGDGHFDQVFPGIVVDRYGNVNVCYYDRRLDPNNFLLWTWLSRSADGGSSWLDHQSSDVGWNHNSTEFSSFIGDYIDVDASSRHVQPFWCDGRSGSQDVYTDPMTVDLFTDVDSISAATGGQVQFSLHVGPNLAGGLYFLLGSISGTDPGLDFGNGIHLPINWDLFTWFTLTNANSAVLQNFRGTLDSSGAAAPLMDTLGPIDPSLAGLQMDFAALVFDQGMPVFGSNATHVVIDP